MSHALREIDFDWFRNVFEISPDPSWIVDGNCLVACNDAAVQTLGYASKDELLGVHPSHLSPLYQPDGIDSYSKAESMMALAREKRLHRFEWAHLKENGTLLLAEVTFYCIQQDSHQVLYCVWRDITDKKDSENRLSSALIEHEIIFQNARIGVIYLVDRKFVRLNKAFEQMFGYSASELLGQTTRIIYASDADYEAAGKEFYAALAANDANNRFDINARTKNGDPRICELVGSLVDPANPKKGSIWLFTDVTELRHTQEQVRVAKKEAELAANKIAASEALYRLLTEDALDVVWKVDQSGQVIYISPADERLRGYPADEVIGQSMLQFFTDEGIDVLRKALKALPKSIQSEGSIKPLTFEAPHRCKDGRTIWGEVLAIPEVDDSGVVVGFHGITREITERKISEEKLARALTELEVIFQNPSTGIVYVVDRVIVRANRTFERLVGRSSSEIIGQSTRFIYPNQEAYEEVGRIFQAAFASGNSCRYDIISPSADGAYRVCEIFGSPVDPLDPMRGSIWLYSDVTELRHAVHALQSAKETATHLAEQVSRLLNNSGQGFLSFKDDLHVQPVYSRACEELLGCNPSGRAIGPLLFPDEPAMQQLFEECVVNAINESDGYTANLCLSLIPNELQLGEYTLHVQYIRVENEIMVVLSDITESRRLERQVERENRRMELIVAALTDGPDLFAAVEEFRDFVTAGASFWHNQVPAELYRMIHTFKGTFNQFGFFDLPLALHSAETTLQDSVGLVFDEPVINRMVDDVFSFDWLNLLDQDLATIADVLGNDFIERRGVVTLTLTQARAYEMLAKRLLTLPAPLSHEQQLLQQLACICLVSLKAEVQQFDRLIQRVAHRLEKSVAPLLVEGPEILVDPDLLGPFLRSLGHVFRNAVDHGIEYPSDRLDGDKREEGQITCRIRRSDTWLIVEIEDDGQGIDELALRAKATAIYPEANRWSLSDLVFADSVSSRDDVTELSGRGVGMAAVRAEVQKLGGIVKVNSRPLLGSVFVFELPWKSCVV